MPNIKGAEYFYKVSVSSITPDLLLEEVNSNTCILGLSLNNPNFSIKYLPSIIKWIDENFPSCYIIINDFPHRFNLQIFNNYDQATSEKESIEIGIDVEKQIIGLLPNNGKFKIFHWLDSKLTSPDDFINSFSKQLYDHHPDVINDIQLECKYFIDKQISRGINLSQSYEHSIFLSSKYIIEEMSFINQLVGLRVKTFVYPGKQLQVLKNFVNEKYSNFDCNLKDAIYIDLKIKK